MRFFAILFIVFFIASCNDSSENKKDKNKNQNKVENQNPKPPKENIENKTFDGKDFYKTFEGTINNSIEIIANLQKKDSIVSGSYYYKNQNQIIRLDGNIIGSKLTISETNDNGEITGTWKTEFVSGTELKGEWISGNNSRKMNLKLKESKNKQAFKVYKLEEKYHFQNNKSLPTCNISMVYLFPKNNESLKKDIGDSFFGSKFNSSDIKSNLEIFSDSLLTSYKEMEKDADPELIGPSYEWSYDIGMEIVFNDENFVCYALNQYEYTGGAHGNGFNLYHIFDLKNKNKITKKEIFKKGTDAKLLAKIIEKLALKNGVKGQNGLKSAGYWVQEIKPNNNIYITKAGVVFHYNAYEIAPYAMGTTEILIPFNEIKNILKTTSPIMRIVK